MASKFKKPVIKRKPTKAMKRFEKIEKELDDSGQVVVGLPKDANAYPDGTSVITVGFVHEFGSPANNIPERSFLRSTIRINRRRYARLMRTLSKQVLTGKASGEKALKILGLKAQSDVQNKIEAINSPPNASSTVRRKGSSNPLIDTGHLRQSITYEIRK